MTDIQNKMFAEVYYKTICNVLQRGVLCLPRLHLFDQKYSQICSTVKYECNLK